MIQLHKIGWLVGGFLLAIHSAVSVAADPKSGYDYIKPTTRAMQDDDFENPGLLAVEQGRDLFNDKQDGTDRACSGCHGLDGEGLAPSAIARYPVYSEGRSEVVTLQHRIGRCWKANAGGRALPTDAPELVAMETFVRHLAAGEVVDVRTDGPMKDLIERGEQIYKTRYGLIDMACYQCHDWYAGRWLRGQKISQGQGNGFPAYRLGTGEITSLGQRIQQWLTLMRAQPFEADSNEIKLLELYIMSRSNGLKIETPAVRY